MQVRTVLPNLDNLRCFEAAAKQLNFRRAAAAVFLSPAAFSERIRQLESEMDVVLFERTTRKVRLTEAGARLLPQARRCLEEARRCVDVARQGETRLPYSLKVGTRYELGMSWLVPALTILEGHHPERTLDLEFGDSADLLARIKTEVLDCAISSVRLTSAGLDYVRLHEERYVFVGAKSLISKVPLKTAEDAARHVLVDAGDDLPLFRYFLDAVGAEAVWGFRKTERLGTIGAILARVRAGAGVAVLPRYFVREHLGGASGLVELLPKVQLAADYFRLIWRAGHPQEASLRALAEELQALPLR